MPPGLAHWSFSESVAGELRINDFNNSNPEDFLL